MSIVQGIVDVLAKIGFAAIGVGALAGTTPRDMLSSFAFGGLLLLLVLGLIQFLAAPHTDRLPRTPELLLCSPSR